MHAVIGQFELITAQIGICSLSHAHVLYYCTVLTSQGEGDGERGGNQGVVAQGAEQYGRLEKRGQELGLPRWWERKSKKIATLHNTL